MSGSQQTFLKDKPYGFIPLNSNCKRTETIPHNSFDTSRYSGRLLLRIHTLTPIHIGDGLIDFKDNNIFIRTMRRNGKVVIPGSSLKGVVRSIAEAISESCAVTLPNPRNQKAEEGLPYSNRDKCFTAKKLCPTCSMFGIAQKNGSYRGKVQFGEFTLIQEGERDQLNIVQMPNLTSPFSDYPKGRENIYGGNERLYYCDLCDDKSGCGSCKKEDFFKLLAKRGNRRKIKFRGRKFYYHNDKQQHESMTGSELYEVIDKNAVLVGTISFENLTKEELGLLCHSLGLGGNINLKIGYGKPAYFGSIKVELVDAEDLLSRYGKGKKIDKDHILKLSKEYPDNQPGEIKKNIKELEKILGIGAQGKPWPGKLY